jgi:hypothetical protein
VGPDQVEDPVVGLLGVFEQRGQGGDGLPRARGRIDEQRTA